MQRVLLALALILILAVTAWSQDAEMPAETDAEESAATEEIEDIEDVEDDAPAEIDESGLDDENYADIEDDDFRPSEDIPADQSIPFPTDI